ncbi:MAG: PDZ domain-containing protein [Stellaceae bacterium]
MPRKALGIIVAGSLLSLLSGCLPGPHLEGTPPEIKTDEFSKTITIEGPSRREYLGLNFTLYTNLFTIIDKATHRYRHQIGVDVVYGTDNQINYRFAADDTAKSLPLIRLAHTRSRVCKDCSREEIFDIDVPDAALRTHAQSGYRVKLSSGLGDSLIIEITPPMIAAQYAALEQVIGPAAAAAQPRQASPPKPTASEPDKAEIEAKPSPPHGLAAVPSIGLEMLPQSTGAMTHGSMHGAVILAVIPGSPAEAAGVRGGDLIVKLDGKLVESGKDILDLIAKAKPHSVVTVDILRGSAHVVARIKL